MNVLESLLHVYKAVLCSLAQLFQNSGNKSLISSAFCVSFINFLFNEEKNIPVEKKLKSYFDSCNAPSASPLAHLHVGVGTNGYEIFFATH